MPVSPLILATVLLCGAGPPVPADPLSSPDCLEPAWAPGRYEPPLVLLRLEAVGERPPVTVVSSADLPPAWTPVPYGPLELSIRFLIAPSQLESITSVQLWLDGAPLPDAQVPLLPRGAPQWREDGRLLVTYRYRLQCPELGKHLLQARYKLDDQWSRLSSPLRFEVRLPEPPRIVALSDFDQVPTPLSRTGHVRVTRPAVKLHLANVNPGDRVIAYLNGRALSSFPVNDSCCGEVQLEGAIAVGVHGLTVRKEVQAADCRLTSEPSNEVMFHYYDQDVYLLRPARGCNNGRWPLKAPCNLPADPPQAESINTPAPSAGSAPRGAVVVPTDRSSLSARVESGKAATMSSQTWVEREASTFALVAFQDAETEGAETEVAARAVADSQALLKKAVGARDQAARIANEAGQQAAEAARSAQAAADAAQAAVEQRDAAAGARNVAREHLAAARAAAVRAAANKVDAAGTAGRRARVATNKVRTAFENASARAHEAAKQAQAALDQARQARAHAADAARARIAADTALEDADLALAQARLLVAEVQQHIDAENQAAAEAAWKRVKLESDAADAARRAAAVQRKLARRAAEAAAGHRDAAERERAHAADRAQHTQREVQTAADELAAAQQAADQAEEATLQSPNATSADLATRRAAVAHQALTAATEDTRLAAEAASQAAQLASRGETLVARARADAEAATAARDRAEHARQTAREILARDTVESVLEGARKHVANLKKHAPESPQVHCVGQHIQRAKEAHAEAPKHREKVTRAHQAAVPQAQLAAAAFSDAAAAQIRLREQAQQAADRAEQSEQARAATAKAHAEAEQAARRALESAQRRDEAAQNRAADQAAEARRAAQQQASAARHHAVQAQQYSQAASSHAQAVAAARRRAAQASGKAREAAREADNAAAAVQGAVTRARAYADVAADLLRREAVLPAPLDAGRANEVAELAKQMAQAEESKAASRIALGEAEARMARAQSVVEPPSPYFFAAPAHFPIREFGPGGEVLDRQGAVIYEDMKFSFDKNGYYEVAFRIALPALPTTIHLQMLVQPWPGGPWHTITLTPMDFPPEQDADGRARPSVRSHVASGHSEVLYRCYGDLGRDALIRRQGTARFGHGFDPPLRSGLR